MQAAIQKCVLRWMGHTRRAAALVGGPRVVGQGCLFACLLSGAVSAEAVTLPSGQDVTLMEERVERDPNVLRLRYLAPAIGSAFTRPAFEKLTEDLDHLCQTVGIPAVAKSELDAPQIIVSLSAEPVEFGALSPDVPQIFEAFTLEDGACMLEVF